MNNKMMVSAAGALFLQEEKDRIDREYSENERKKEFDRETKEEKHKSEGASGFGLRERFGGRNKGNLVKMLSVAETLNGHQLKKLDSVLEERSKYDFASSNELNKEVSSRKEHFSQSRQPSILNGELENQGEAIRKHFIKKTSHVSKAFTSRLDSASKSYLTNHYNDNIGSHKISRRKSSQYPLILKETIRSVEYKSQMVNEKISSFVKKRLYPYKIMKPSEFSINCMKEIKEVQKIGSNFSKHIHFEDSFTKRRNNEMKIREFNQEKKVSGTKIMEEADNLDNEFHKIGVDLICQTKIPMVVLRESMRKIKNVDQRTITKSTGHIRDSPKPKLSIESMKNTSTFYNKYHSTTRTITKGAISTSINLQRTTQNERKTGDKEISFKNPRISLFKLGQL